MPALVDLTGRTFGRLTVLRKSDAQRRNAYWLCRCECGIEKVVQGGHLRKGLIKSCGCLRKETNIENGKQCRHGMTGTPTHRTWRAMLERCLHSSNASYKNYGGRGITVCKRWLTFENFYADMGLRLPGMSIDRINNDGNYEPGNCRWATAKEQRRNQRVGS